MVRGAADEKAGAPPGGALTWMPLVEHHHPGAGLRQRERGHAPGDAGAQYRDLRVRGQRRAGRGRARRREPEWTDGWPAGHAGAVAQRTVPAGGTTQ